MSTESEGMALAAVPARIMRMYDGRYDVRFSVIDAELCNDIWPDQSDCYQQ